MKRILHIAVYLLVASACPLGAQTWDTYPADVLLVIDHSTSVVWRDSCGIQETRLDFIHRACTLFVDSLLADTTVENRVGIIYFWGIRPTIDPPDPPWSQFFNFTSDKDSILGWLADKTNAPGTFLISAMDSALYYMSMYGRSGASKSIIILTDGAANIYDYGSYGNFNNHTIAVMGKINFVKDSVKAYSIGIGSDNPLMTKQEMVDYGLNTRPDTMACDQCCEVAEYSQWGAGSSYDEYWLTQIATQSGTTPSFTIYGTDINPDEKVRRRIVEYIYDRVAE